MDVMDNWDDGIENPFTKSADETKLGTEEDMSDGRAILQRYVDGLEEWASKNCVKFNKDSCKVRHLGWHNQRAQYRLGSVRLGRSLDDEDFGVLVDNKLNMAQQCTATTTKAN